LYTAVRALRADARLQGLTHTQLLAVLVLMAKTNHLSGEVRTTARELGRWLGVSESSVDHDVFPDLVAAKAVRTQVVTAPSGRVEGVSCRVEPLWEVRGSYGAPLALTKKEFAVLLRLVEALFAPGWANSDTEPGLLADRQGKGAATDRLALLLLVLECREDGTVPLVGGTVVEGRGRGAATLARVLGGSVSGASKVLGRLRQWDVVATPLRPARTGMRGKQLLVVPAVAAALAEVKGLALHREVALAEGVPGPAAPPACAGCVDAGSAGEGHEGLLLEGEGWRQESFEDVLEENPDAAPRDLEYGTDDECAGQHSTDEAEVGVKPEIPGSPAATSLHAQHAGVAELGDVSAGDSGFSGSAVGGGGDLPERVRTREDAAGSSTSRAGGAEGGPLRGERRDQFRKGEGKASSGAVAFRRPASVPEDLGEALAPVARLWALVGRSSTRAWLADMVRSEVGRLRGLVGPELAQTVLAERLKRRLDGQGPWPVRDVAAWLLKRGLPQRPDCWSTLCDGGVRIDTRGDCESCQVLVGDRRGLRRAVADQVLEDRLSGRLVLPDREVGREVERRLQEAVRAEMVRKAAARERAVAEQTVREASYEIKRRAAEEAKWARAAAPCADCGLPEASGLCLGCTERRGITAALADAVEFAVVVRFDPDDGSGTRTLWQDCARATQAALDARLGELREQGLNEAAVAFSGRRLIEELRDRRRHAVLVWLGQQEEAEQAARMAASALRRKQFHPETAEAIDAVREAGEAARRRVAERWLGELLAELHTLLSFGPARAEHTDWTAVLPALAVRPLLDGDRAETADATAGARPAGAVRELVSA
jgi:hypothetical protein